MAVKITLDKSGNIAELKISRPSWNTEAKNEIPTESGEDRRHVVAWWVMREAVVNSLRGHDLNYASAYLAKQGFNVASSAKADVENGLWEFVRDLFNKVDNLWPGAAKPNRFLGAHIRQADDMMENRASLVYPVMLTYDIPDEKGGSSKAVIPLNDQNQVIDWLFNMAVDWEDATDIKNGAKGFEEFLKAKGI